jgi:uncharacterized protein (TIGR03663 family)
MIRRYGFAVALAALTILAAALRLPSLGNRIFHGDEAVHAFKFRELWEQGVYRYDPNEFHGPTLYYAALPAVWLNGRHSFAETRESDYRLATALVGIALIPLLALIRDGLGRRATLFAALFLAISPAFVFYSRYYIQEILLVFFTLAAVACGWRYSRSRKLGWLAGIGVSAGLMVATKETAVIAFAAAIVAFLLVRKSRGPTWEGEAPAEPGGVSSAGASPSQNVSPSQIASPGLSSSRSPSGARVIFKVTATALIVAYLLLSGFLSNPAGPLGYFHTFTPWLQRAGGTDIHNHPWYYYLSMLLWTHRASGPIWSEALIVVLALIGMTSVFAPVRTCASADLRFLKFIALFAIILTVAYSAIPYKTPWCVLSFLGGMGLMAGVGACTLLRLAPGIVGKGLVGMALIMGSIQLRSQAYRTSFEYQADGLNPYVYAMPVPDILELGHTVDELARVSRDGSALVIKVIATDDYYWPLPWYIRQMTNVGYYTSLPEDPAAPIVIASPEYDETLSKRLDRTHLMTGYRGLRPGVMFEVWVRMDVWTDYVKRKNQNRPSEPSGS